MPEKRHRYERSGSSARPDIGADTNSHGWPSPSRTPRPARHWCGSAGGVFVPFVLALSTGTITFWLTASGTARL